ncbi:MAG: type II toxin-antitoxin system RelE family toxin [Haloechinothrix sp.]
MNQRRRYALTFVPAAARAIRKLPRDVAARIKTATEGLRDDPRPHGVRALVGQQGLLRIRVGDYRVLYEIHDDELVILVVRVAHRSTVYRSR